MRVNVALIVTMMITMGLGLTGCASTSENMIAKGYGESYSQGYEDGCETGRKAAGALFVDFNKDVNRFNRETKYRQGWGDGYEVCRSEQIQMIRSSEASSRERAIRDRYKNR